MYIGDEIVVDLSGSTPTQVRVPYHEDSLQCIFSAGKSVAAILIAMMVDQGYLAYEEQVSTYWPEFSQFGKQDITV